MRERFAQAEPTECVQRSLASLREVSAIVDAKAPDEAAAFKTWLLRGDEAAPPRAAPAPQQAPPAGPPAAQPQPQAQPAPTPPAPPPVVVQLPREVATSIREAAVDDGERREVAGAHEGAQRGSRPAARRGRGRHHHHDAGRRWAASAPRRRQEPDREARRPARRRRRRRKPPAVAAERQRLNCRGVRRSTAPSRRWS